MMLSMILRNEALLMLDKRGALLEVSRQLSSIMQVNHISGAIIGGVAVVLHGHIRTTRDVDVWINQPLASFRPVLEAAGAKFDAKQRQFILESVPIHLVDSKMVRPPPKRTMTIENITTVTLADLINIKLRSGLSNIARAQDIADVIGLIRANNLRSNFAAKLDKGLRSEFRKLVKAIA
jgi:hypothetical protein